MKFVMFYHSLVSDWNHGNAHFLRGVVSELKSHGHEVAVYEPENGWSRSQLLAENGLSALVDFADRFKNMESHNYNPENLDLGEILADTDVVIVHEWNEHWLVKAVGDYRKRTQNLIALFHDTHHRSVTAPREMEAYDLSGYDGVLAFGEVIKDIYQKKKWAQNVWVWHEAADTNIFKPIKSAKKGDLVWIGNWGDDERTEELLEFIIEPVKKLGLKAKFYGVRYPDHALKALADASIEYGGWLPNFKVPHVFSEYKVTVHVPRRPYVQALPGIPTIRPFEAMACGIPLVCSPWEDSENLFHSGKDYLVANSGAEMTELLEEIVSKPSVGAALSANALNTLRARHTCAHRVEELLRIVQSLQPSEQAREPLANYKMLEL